MFTRLFCIFFASLALAACGLLDETYHFRMAVEVDTPEGMRTGSSVYEVSAGKRWKILPDAKGWDFYVRGEAVAVDIAPGQTLFALLETNAHFEDMVGLSMEALDPQFTDNYDVVGSAARLSSRGEMTSPVVLDPAKYPVLVTFADIDDPTSVQSVESSDLAASFGEGVSLRRITVRLTEDPVTTGIGTRLKWLDRIEGTLVHRPRHLPIGEMPEEQRLTEMDFRMGTSG